MRKVLEKFYGPLARNWSINRRVYEVFGRMIVESKRCTEAMHLVPRPWNLSNPGKWALKQVRQAAVRYFLSPDGEHYIACMRFAARNYRTEFELASSGI
ncbi:MAG: hypothetical protein ACREPV_11545 [Lysobacter sp.]